MAHAHQFEFGSRDTAATPDTMTEDAYVNRIPVMTGGISREQLREFYAQHFEFTHTIEMAGILFGHRADREACQGSARGNRQISRRQLAYVHVCWDQALVLAQIGLLDSTNLPICGVESAHKVLDPSCRKSPDGARDASASVV